MATHGSTAEQAQVSYFDFSSDTIQCLNDAQALLMPLIDMEAGEMDDMLHRLARMANQKLEEAITRLDESTYTYKHRADTE